MDPTVMDKLKMSFANAVKPPPPPKLPNELIDIVLEYLVDDNLGSPDDVLSFLLTCRGCNRVEFQKFLYRTVCFEPSWKGMAALQKIAEDPDKAPLVKDLVFTGNDPQATLWGPRPIGKSISQWCDGYVPEMRRITSVVSPWSNITLLPKFPNIEVPHYRPGPINQAEESLDHFYKLVKHLSNVRGEHLRTLSMRVVTPYLLLVTIVFRATRTLLLSRSSTKAVTRQPSWAAQLETFTVDCVELSQWAIHLMIKLPVDLRIANAVFREKSFEMFEKRTQLPFLPGGRRPELARNNLHTVTVSGLLIIADEMFRRYDGVWVVGDF
jgi:hypothetical protein